MKDIQYPAPLKSGSKIALTAFSSGIAPEHLARFRLVLDYLHSFGFTTVQGECFFDQQKQASASAEQRAQELMGFLLDDSIDAIAPPWGGELAMEVLPLLDFEKLRSVKPKWIIGFSDISTVNVALTSKLNWATLHCSNLMDQTGFTKDPLTQGTISHLMTPSSGEFVQHASQAHSHQWANFVANPSADFEFDKPTQWQWLVKPSELNQQSYSEDVIEGRLIGGCWDTLRHLFMTPYLDLANLKCQSDAPLILYLENAEMPPVELARTILSMKFKGVFEQVSALVLGRCACIDSDNSNMLTYHEVLKRHLTPLGIPVLTNVDIGHVPPNLTLVNGAFTRISLANKGEIIQRLN